MGKRGGGGVVDQLVAPPPPPHTHWLRTWGSSKAVIGQFNMRKKTTTKNRHLPKICPFVDCHKVLRGTLHRHLVNVHNVAKGSEEHKQMLSVAKCYSEPPKNDQMCSPQKDFGVNQKIHSKCKGLLNTVEGNTDM